MPATKEKKHTVLLTEKDVIVRFAIAQHLRLCGWSVIEAASAREAMSIFMAGAKVDVLLCDAQLAEGASGFALAQWVRRNRRNVEIILTGGILPKAEAAEQLCSRRNGKPVAHADRLADQIKAMMATRDRSTRSGPLALPRRPRKSQLY